MPALAVSGLERLQIPPVRYFNENLNLNNVGMQDVLASFVVCGCSM